MPKIRLVIVDDSLYFRTFLTQRLARDISLDIVGCFSDPVEAAANIKTLRPDVVLTDMEMPIMRGNEFIKEILPKNPGVRAVIMSSLSGNVFDAMHAGAIDFVVKPGAQARNDDDPFIQDVIQKIKIAATAHVIAPGAAAARSAAAAVAAVTPARSSLPGASPDSVIAIGASTGGTEAILKIITRFPANTPGVVIVQHMPPDFTRMYAERADKACAMRVFEAKSGDRVERGVIAIAPGGDQQMYLRRDARGYYVHLARGEKVSGHCPSVDVLFDSVSLTAGKSAVGVILTGMGADGARGLTAMRKNGAHTIGQDEASCVVYGMPLVAYEMGGVSEQLPLTSIADAVLRRFSR